MLTGHTRHPFISRSYNGDVDRYPCIYPCWTLPYVELQTHEFFPVGSQILAPLLADASQGFWRDSTIPKKGTRDTMAWICWTIFLAIRARRDWCTPRLSVPEVSYGSFALDKCPCPLVLQGRLFSRKLPPQPALPWQGAHCGGQTLQWWSHYEMTFLGCSWFALGLDSTYVCGCQGELLPVELSQRHSLLFLRKFSKHTTHPNIGATQDVQAVCDLRRTFLICIVSQSPPGVHRLRSHGWALLPLPWDVAVWPSMTLPWWKMAVERGAYNARTWHQKIRRC